MFTECNSTVGNDTGADDHTYGANSSTNPFAHNVTRYVTRAVTDTDPFPGGTHAHPLANEAGSA